MCEYTQGTPTPRLYRSPGSVSIPGYTLSKIVEVFRICEYSQGQLELA